MIWVLALLLVAFVLFLAAYLRSMELPDPLIPPPPPPLELSPLELDTAFPSMRETRCEGCRSYQPGGVARITYSTRDFRRVIVLPRCALLNLTTGQARQHGPVAAFITRTCGRDGRYYEAAEIEAAEGFIP